MTTTRRTFLNDRGIVLVEGEDAATFLQGLVTNDVEALPEGEARYAALLSPQGKILFDMLVFRVAAGTDLRAAGASAVYALDCAAVQAADLAKRLGFYKLRARVSVRNASADLGVVASWVGAGSGGGAAGSEGVSFADPRAPELGSRAILPRAEAEAVGESDRAAYEALRISLGVPSGGVDFAYGDAFPHDAALDLLNGVDFGKGCFVGQEVVSRMKHRGGARKRVVRVALSDEAPPPGAAVMDGELPVGALGSGAGREALAMLRLDRAEDAKVAGRRLLAGSVEVTIADDRRAVA